MGKRGHGLGSSVAAPLDRILARGRWIRWRGRERRLRAELAAVGDGFVIRSPWKVSHPAEVVIGDDVYIGPNGHFSTSGGLRIGRSCRFGPHVMLFTWNHDLADTTRLPYGPGRREQPVVIGDYVWIGARATIAPGVTIGDGAVVAMAAVVTADVARGTIVGGNPAREIGRRDQATFEVARAAMEGRAPRPSAASD